MSIDEVVHVLELLEQYDIAAARAPGYRGLDDPGVPGSFDEFNCGVLAWRRSERTETFLADWQETYEAWLVEEEFPGVRAASRSGRADQPAFRHCAWKHGLDVFVLPPEYNFRLGFPADGRRPRARNPWRAPRSGGPGGPVERASRAPLVASSPDPPPARVVALAAGDRPSPAGQGADAAQHRAGRTPGDIVSRAERASLGEAELLAELRDARESERTIPRFFVVGHAKSGTTALHAMLASHPEIFVPKLRETQFLARGPSQRSAGPDTGEGTRPRTLEAYLALFDGAAPGQLPGEISTAYLRTPAAAARIQALSPDARIVAFFRDPASFIVSLHLQALQVGFETERDLGRALALEPERAQGRSIPAGCPWPDALLYSRHVRYPEQLREYRALFGAERVLALVYEDFRADNDAVVRGVYRFLGVADSVEIPRIEANPTVRVGFRRAGPMIDSLARGRGPAVRALGSVVKTLTPAAARRRAVRTVKGAFVDRAPAPPDERQMAELRERFASEVRGFGALMGRDLTAVWGRRE